MTWIKICGITNLEDALAAVHAGADALGFVFYKKSSRKVDWETVREIVSQLPPDVEKVGVFADASPEVVSEVAERAQLTALQLHFTSWPIGPSRSQQSWTFGKRKVYLALPAALFIESGAQWTVPDRSSAAFSAIFLDSGNFQQPGGTGKTFEWQKAAPSVEAVGRITNVVVAGGLDPFNVAEAIRILKPWGVDVSSGVEATAGKKDPKKVQGFIAAVRAAHKS